MAATAFTVIAVGGVAIATSSPSTIKACSAKSGGALRLASHCKSSENKVKWDVAGPRGLQGIQGVPGEQGTIGPQGIQGIQGPAGISHVDYAYHICSNNTDGTQTSCTVQCPVAGEIAIGGGGLGQGGFADHQELNASVPANATGGTVGTGDTPTGWKVYMDNGVGGTQTIVYVFADCISSGATITSAFSTGRAAAAK